MKRDPWELGRAYAAEADEIPPPAELQAKFGLSPRQALLCAFGFAEGQGYKFPPMFRAKVEWRFRTPSDLDETVVMIDAFAVGMDENDKIIFRRGEEDDESVH
jgi:hypothetical protein